MGKKNLDKLFQEKFKDFSGVPDDRVWNAIETSLDNKKKSRKIIPIWWKLGGVAAMLLLGLFIWNPFEEKTKELPTITDVNSETKKSSEENTFNEPLDAQNSNENSVVNTQKNNELKKETDTSVEKVASTDLDLKKKSKQNSIKNLVQKNLPKNEDVTSIQDKTKEHQELRPISLSKNELEINPSVIVASKASNSAIQKQTSEEIQNNVQETPFSNENITEDGLALIEKTVSNQNTENHTSKKSIFEEIEAQEKEELITENSGSKWSAGPSIAPVYFNAMGEGSPVHSIFVPNSKSGDINFSYGLSVAYEVNKKLSLRSGVHKVDFGYSTNDIAFTSSLNTAENGQLDNVDYSFTSRTLVVNSKANNQIETLSQNADINPSSKDVSSASVARDGVMEQQFGYLEVPVELNYALIDKRFGFNLIGGVSSLFLVENSISLTAGELTTEMGQANNINSVNFSTNVGFGLNYKFTSKIHLNVEPVFKYQLNTFSTTDGTFNPFSIGVYSGLRFKF